MTMCTYSLYPIPVPYTLLEQRIPESFTQRVLKHTILPIFIRKRNFIRLQRQMLAAPISVNFRNIETGDTGIVIIASYVIGAVTAAADCRELATCLWE